MASSSVREPPFRVAVEKNVTAVLRDGTVLRADLYHPDLKGKFPTIIERTPYDKGSFAERGNSFAERGYLYVAQDIRGRYASDGDFSGGFYRRDHTEADDGHPMLVRRQRRHSWELLRRLDPDGAGPRPASASEGDNAAGNRGEPLGPRDERRVAAWQGPVVDN